MECICPNWNGSKWQSKLRIFTYEIAGKPTSIDFYQGNLLDIERMLPDVAAGKICKITAFGLNLQGNSVANLTLCKALLKHSFVEIKTENGNLATFEKNTGYILMQLCKLKPVPHPPVVRVRLENGKRNWLGTMKILAIESNPPDATIMDVLTWVHETKELEEPYHVADSNCQQFCANLWFKFASTMYPNPAKYLGQRCYEKDPFRLYSYFFSYIFFLILGVYGLSMSISKGDSLVFYFVSTVLNIAISLIGMVLILIRRHKLSYLLIFFGISLAIFIAATTIEQSQQKPKYKFRDRFVVSICFYFLICFFPMAAWCGAFKSDRPRPIIISHA